MRAQAPRSASIERGLARMRAAGMLLFTGFLVAFPGLASDARWSVGVLAFGWLYAFALITPLAERVPWRGAVTMVADGVFVLAWIASTGGFASHFFPVIYLSIMVSVLLVGEKGTLPVTLAYAAGYVGVAALAGPLAPHFAGLLVRIGFMGLTGAFALVFSRDVATRAREGAFLRERVVAAEDAEARFRGLLESAPDAIVISNAEGAIEFANERAAILFASSREALAGARLSSLLEQAPDGAWQGKRADGTRFPAEASSQPHATPGGRVVTSIVRDVTESRRAAEALRDSEARFRALASAAFEGIAIHDDGIVLEANEAMAAIYGYSQRELIGMRALDLVAPESGAIVAEHLATRRTDPYEIEGLRKDGTRITLDVVGRDYPYQGRTVRVTAIRDVTERRRAEAERDASRDKLRELDRLREINEMKTQLINTAAHELGTPLTPIKLHLHLMRTQRATSRSEAEERSLAVIERNVDRLIRLVQDFLDVARLEARKLAIDRKPTDVNRVVVEAVESFAESARLSGVALESRLTPDLTVDADARRISQVIFNLLSNALKFTPQGGSVVVETRRGDGAAVVRVVDTGAGLTLAQIERLFQPFSQVHDTMQKTRSGTGLGLYISRGIVEQHGGTITCASAGPGKGATFTVTLPMRAPEATRAPEHVDVHSAGSIAGRARDLV